MPDINRIRVNNVKYNFGTQYYDDFTMRMYGKNTLYDLANGGGKSVLMLLLLQNLIPNCTLDDKQPIEKLFRTGNKNTVIHSLIEWNLDEPDINEGYRYMTTGFCAKKANEQADDDNGVASVEYFNYCIFYRDYNKNDIINLPLTRNGERISYHALRAYLKDLEHHSQELIVKVFDRKGEYQRYISRYGLHESQWEIIRGINKTEGHVRTYFETNYKTTRKVVEDLLIEEIIEKAFMVKTGRDVNTGDTMADTLVDIKDRLALLAKKKKDIADYDHQKELIKLLSDRIRSFSGIYKDMETVSERLVGIYLAGKEYVAQSESRQAELEREKEEKAALKKRQAERMECLKVSRDKRLLEALRSDIELLVNNKERLTGVKTELERKYNLEECRSDYAEYLEEKEGYMRCRAELNELKKINGHGHSEGEDIFKNIQIYVRRLKTITDRRTKELEDDIKRITAEEKELEKKSDYCKKTLYESELRHAVDEHDLNMQQDRLAELRGRFSAESLKLHETSLEEADVRLEKNRDEQKMLQDETDIINKNKIESEKTIHSLESELLVLDEKLSEKKLKEKELVILTEKCAELAERLDKLKLIYGKESPDELARVIEERMGKAAGDLNDCERERSVCIRRLERLKSGLLLDIPKDAERIIDYITTRHGIYAMYGMDYISVLKTEEKEKLLKENPMLPYGVLVKDFEKIKSDAVLKEFNTLGSAVNIYDMDNLGERAILYGNNIISAGASNDFFINPDTKEGLLKSEKENLNDINERIKAIKDMTEALRDDLKIIPSEEKSSWLRAPEQLSDLRDDIAADEEKVRSLRDKMSEYKSDIEKLQNNYDTASKRLDILKEDEALLCIMSGILDEISETEENIARLKTSVGHLHETKAELEKEEREARLQQNSLHAVLDDRKKKLAELTAEWKKYAEYYHDDEGAMQDGCSIPGVSDMSAEELKAKINVYAGDIEKDRKQLNDKKELMDTIEKGMKRILETIEKRNVSVSVLEEMAAKGEIYRTEAAVMEEYKANIRKNGYDISALEKSISEKNREADRLEGSIVYAVKNIEAAFGRYTDEAVTPEEAEVMLRDGEELMRRLRNEEKECEERCRQHQKEQGYMTDLYKDAKRIIQMNGIDMENATLCREETGNLRDLFEDALVKYDGSKKQLERARREIEKFKQTVSNTLQESGAIELSSTIRDNADVPENYAEAEKLIGNLDEITDYLTLERDSIEKGLYDMELLKENFEEQCLQRCLDVKTELDKLDNLSRIILDGEAVKMTDLHVPYVKQEFMRQRMSDYIDSIVKQADTFKDDKERKRYIRNSLSLKKLFGVIVTDMNMIKLSLYKRERISRNSRYLKYEEAVGSTGQSQGIYIQFLISIINYISGMYGQGSDGRRTGTIFIDNPFGAAKDIYIWEPIFALLKANNIQLIVPARGATPAITGRFDVNYVLGQKMEGDKQLTVVADYTSSVDQEALEYHELTFEQETFDFI